MKQFGFTIVNYGEWDDGHHAAIEVATHPVLQSGKHLQFAQACFIDAKDNLITRIQAYEPCGADTARRTRCAQSGLSRRGVDGLANGHHHLSAPGLPRIWHLSHICMEASEQRGKIADGSPPLPGAIRW
jgi:hypothetical protein